nr:HAMP domain-containing sensor histidine kinase [Niveibacterium umoris]
MDSIPGAIAQIITNLVGNALTHAYDENGSGSIRITGALRDDTVELSIADDGRGMSAEVQPRIFDPFFTTRMGKGGTGLGLSIVHSLVTNVLKGTISVQSAPGYGTQFTIRCPRLIPRTTGQEDNAVDADVPTLSATDNNEPREHLTSGAAAQRREHDGDSAPTG